MLRADTIGGNKLARVGKYHESFLRPAGGALKAKTLRPDEVQVGTGKCPDIAL
jgi:hypothetical protein